MRKRRRLADKLTIMVCAVLVAVSAFFYAPLDVSAEESLNFHSDVNLPLLANDLSDDISKNFTPLLFPFYTALNNHTVGSIDFSDYFTLDSSVLYSVDVTTSLNVVSALPIYAWPCTTFMNFSDSSFYLVDAEILKNESTLNYGNDTKKVFFYGGQSVADIVCSGIFYSTSSGSIDIDISVSFTFSNFTQVNSSSSGDYQNGYNAGYSAGQQAGYGNGYSNGFADGEASVDTDSIYNQGFEAGKDSVDTESYYDAGYSAGQQAGYGNGYSNGFADGEASVDTDSIYNQGFEAGKDSVDTDSIYNQGFEAGKDSVDPQLYYDAGYQAGYQVGVQESFDIGYQEGYQSAMDRIDSWGADTSDYPLLILDSPLKSKSHSITVKSSIPTRYFSFDNWTYDYDFNPNHTYRFDVVLTPTQYKEGSADIYFMEYEEFYFNIGGIKYHLSNFSGAGVNRFFIPGDRISNAYSFSWEPLLAVMGDTFESGTAFCYFDLSYQIYDMGPSGDTQNHIANQTDQLIGGYNDSQGNSVNNDFSSGLNEFETAEDSLFATAATGMKDFTFFDISSVPAMVTGMSFVGSIMSGWFTQAGGPSGVGIVLSILFSIMLVAMVLGLYRWYQSKGGKD